MLEFREETTEGGHSPRRSSGPEDRQEIREASKRCTGHGTAGGARSATANTTHEEELKCRLPQGSVYMWAAMLDGANTSDAIVGWIVLLVSETSSCLWLRNTKGRCQKPKPGSCLGTMEYTKITENGRMNGGVSYASHRRRRGVSTSETAQLSLEVKVVLTFL